jgi:PAS domain S-box-containing protein
VLASAAPIIGTDGVLTHVVISLVEIPDRMNEKRLFLQAFNVSSALMAISSLEDGRFIDVNDTFCEKTEYSREEIIGKTSKELNLFIDYSKRQEVVIRMQSDGRVRNVEATIRAKSGRELKGFFNADIIMYEEKKHLLTLFNDLSETFAALEFQRRAEQEWQQTFDGSRDAICLLDPDHKIVRCNRAMADLFHKTRDEITGKFCYEVVHGTIKPVEGCPVARMVKSLRRETMELRVDGRWFEVSADPILGDNGTLSGMVHSVRDITERIRSREELAGSEEKYRALAESSPEMIYLIDRDGVVRYINTAAAKMFHAKAGNIIGKHLQDLYPAPVAERHVSAIKCVIKTGKPLATEMLEPFPGGMCWIDARLAPIRDGSGAITGVLGLSQDISERKRMEQELKKSIELYHDLVETAQDLIWQCDTEGRYTYLNPAWESVFGYRLDEMLGKRFTDFQPPEQAALDSNEFLRLLRSGMTMGYESMHRSKDGRDIHLVFNAKYIRDAEGTVVGTRGTAYDITERKKIELELRKSEERLSSLFSNMAEGVALHEVLCDDAGTPVNYRIIDCNLPYEKIIGIKRENVLGKLATEVYGTPEPPYLNEFTTPGMTGVPAHLETYFAPMDKYFDISIAPWGKNGFATIFTDITQRKKMEDELMRKQKFDALSVMAGGIAHDFNNLLAGVFGFMDLARESMKPGDPAAGYLGKAFIAFERAKALSRQLLTFSKGGAPVKKPLDIPDLLRECSNLSLSGSNVRCIFSIPGDRHTVDADENQLSQVFSNIMINARQAMPDGGSFTIGAEHRTIAGNDAVPLPAGRYVVVTLADDGVGIPEKIIDKIFDPFFSTKQQGSGLGLAISYSIVKRHGGHLSVTSKPGEGATFAVWLPVSDKPASVDGGAIGAGSIKGTGSILVMDDEPSIREMAVYMLKSAGYSVVTSTDGREAVEKFRAACRAKKPFDLVILDLTVPGGMGGEKAVVELKKIDPEVTACVTSGYADNAILSDPAAYGFAAMIAKPYRLIDLLKTVKEAIGKRSGKTGIR